MTLHFLLAEPSHAAPGEDVLLTGTEAHHAATVRRVRIGEAVTIGDGAGTWFEGECVTVTPREVIVRVASRREIPAPIPRVTLVQALAKGDRDELAIQAATELGVDSVVPWQAARSVSRWDAAKAEKGRARWATIVREAAKQAHRPWLPSVEPVQTTKQLLTRTQSARVLILEPGAQNALSGLDFSGTSDIVLVVGPEGGITEEELAQFTSSGATLVRLGETVLRTSTAGPAAIAVISATLGRW
ncbi:16S rRNA (uracil(1498)-N(3))-methyltransferase [Microbacterium lacus]|uniref:16S rRNA (uracil(1498)-N(3))-methyltransferase n=1 Tax=Microbacterium lacus TaxID=415217 RepID=UPI00384C16ED